MKGRVEGGRLDGRVGREYLEAKIEKENWQGTMEGQV